MLKFQKELQAAIFNYSPSPWFAKKNLQRSFKRDLALQSQRILQDGLAADELFHGNQAVSILVVDVIERPHTRLQAFRVGGNP